jgi:hypothetical protein
LITKWKKYQLKAAADDRSLTAADIFRDEKFNVD